MARGLFRALLGKRDGPGKERRAERNGGEVSPRGFAEPDWWAEERDEGGTRGKTEERRSRANRERDILGAKRTRSRRGLKKKSETKEKRKGWSLRPRRKEEDLEGTVNLRWR